MEVGFGLTATTFSSELEFMYIFKERHDLVMSKSILNSPYVHSLVEILLSENVERQIENRRGYEITFAGEMIEI